MVSAQPKHILNNPEVCAVDLFLCLVMFERVHLSIQGEGRSIHMDLGKQYLEKRHKASEGKCHGTEMLVPPDHKWYFL